MAGNAHPARTSGLHLFGGYDRGMVPKVLFAGFKVHFHWCRKDPPSPPLLFPSAGLQASREAGHLAAYVILHCTTYLLSGARV